MFQKKSLGQNFLRSESAINKIVEAGNIKENDIIIEIGPGEGVLTNKILEKTPEKLFIIEKDDRLIPILSEKFKNQNVKIIHSDVLDIKEFSEIINESFKSNGLKNKKSVKNVENSSNKYGQKKYSYKIIANIPYYITGLIIRNIFSQNILPEKVILLMQKEVVDRIVSADTKNKNKESLLSASIKFYGNPKKIANVPRGAFVPAPNVDSAILEISDIKQRDRELVKVFFEIVKRAFSHKRKKLVKNLEGLYGKSSADWVIFLNKHLPNDKNKIMNFENIRAEDVDTKDFIIMAKNILN